MLDLSKLQSFQNGVRFNAFSDEKSGVKRANLQRKTVERKHLSRLLAICACQPHGRSLAAIRQIFATDIRVWNMKFNQT
jgi:hypothetical protein